MLGETMEIVASLDDTASKRDTPFGCNSLCFHNVKHTLPYLSICWTVHNLISISSLFLPHIVIIVCVSSVQFISVQFSSI